MPGGTKDLNKLYDYLNKQKYNTGGDFKTFADKLTSDDKFSKDTWNYMHQNMKGVPDDLATFQSSIGFKKKVTPIPASTTTTSSTPPVTEPIPPVGAPITTTPSSSSAGVSPSTENPANAPAPDNTPPVLAPALQPETFLPPPTDPVVKTVQNMATLASSPLAAEDMIQNGIPYDGRSVEDMARDNRLNQLGAEVQSQDEKNKLFPLLHDPEYQQGIAAVNKDSKDPMGHLQIAHAYLSQSERDPTDGNNLMKAQNAYQNALDNDPKNQNALQGLAYVYSHTGDPQGALDIYKKLSELHPDQQDATELNNAAYNFALLGKNDKALEAVNGAISVTDGHAPASFYMNLATIQKNLGNIPESNKALWDARSHEAPPGEQEVIAKQRQDAQALQTMGTMEEPLLKGEGDLYFVNPIGGTISRAIAGAKGGFEEWLAAAKEGNSSLYHGNLKGFAGAYVAALKGIADISMSALTLTPAGAGFVAGTEGLSKIASPEAVQMLMTPVTSMLRGAFSSHGKGLPKVFEAPAALADLFGSIALVGGSEAILMGDHAAATSITKLRGKVFKGEALTNDEVYQASRIVTANTERFFKQVKKHLANMPDDLSDQHKVTILPMMTELDGLMEKQQQIRERTTNDKAGLFKERHTAELEEVIAKIDAIKDQVANVIDPIPEAKTAETPQEKAADVPLKEGDEIKEDTIFYRAPSGWTNDKSTTAQDVVDFESDENGNEEVRDMAKKAGVDLTKRSARDIIWVTAKKEDANRYTRSEDDPDETDESQVEEEPIPKGSKVIATDGDNGYLILKPEEEKVTKVKKNKNGKSTTKGRASAPATTNAADAESGQDKLPVELPGDTGAGRGLGDNASTDVVTTPPVSGDGSTVGEGEVKTQAPSEQTEEQKKFAAKTADAGNRVTLKTDDDEETTVPDNETETTEEEPKPEPPKEEPVKEEEPAVGEQAPSSILNQPTDLKGGDKELWMKTKEETVHGETGSAIKSAEKVHLKSVQKALDGEKYHTAIADGRMTASDAKAIIESAGLEVPKEINDLAAGETVVHQASMVPKIFADHINNFINQDLVPGTKTVALTVKDIYDIFIHALAPRAYSPRLATDALMRMLGDRNKIEFVLDATTKHIEKMFDGMSQDDQVAFIDKFKEGGKQPTPELQAVADLLKKIDKDLYDETQKHAPNLTWKNDHFRVMWKVVPGSMKQSGTLGFFKRPIQGSKGMMKKSTLDSMSEGIDLGGVPVSYNPMTLFKITYADSMKFITAQRMWKGMKKMGMIKFVKKGHDIPDGFDKVEDAIANVYFKTDVGMVNTGVYYAEKGVARLLNNYISTDHIRATQAGRGLLYIKNNFTAVELSLSAFHAVFETFETASSAIGLGLRQFVNLGLAKGDLGKMAKGLKTIATSPASPFFTAQEGARGIKFISSDDFKNSDAGQAFIKQYPDAERLMDDLFQGGGKLQMSADYKINTIRTFREAIKDDNYIGAALRAVPAGLETMMKPLFETYIPRLKVGMFLKEYSQALAENEGRIVKGKVTRAQLSRKTWDFVEQRLGEMNFDNLFWNNTMKTAMQLTFRSVTWKLGSIKALGGAVPEQLIEFANAFKERRAPLLTPKLSWVFGLATLQAAMATVMMKAFTGKYPKTLTDFIAPQVNPDDKDERVVIPTYMKDVLHAVHSPSEYITSSTAGDITRLIDLYKNEDFYGYQIRDTHAGALKQLGQALAYEVPVPMSFGSFQAMRKKGEPWQKQVMGFAGFTKAPQYITQDDTENKIFDLYRLHNAGQKSFSAKAANQAKQDIISLYKKNDIEGAGNMLQQKISEGLLRPSQIPDMLRSMREPVDVSMFQALPFDDKLYLWEDMTKEEQLKYDPTHRFAGQVMQREANMKAAGN